MVRAVWILLLLLISACNVSTDAVSEDVREEESELELYWPPSPAKTRIRYSHSFSGPVDLGYRESFSNRFKDFMAGGSFPGMSRPYAIAVSEKHTAIADPGLSAVHLFDHSRKRFRLLKEINGNGLSSPIGVALGKNRLFISDSALNQVFVLDDRQRLVREIDQLDRPTGIAFASDQQYLFVADTHAHKVMKYDQEGTFVGEIGRRGNLDGEFNFPTHVMVNGTHLFVNDTLNFRVQVFDIESGAHVASIGEHGDSPGYLAQPKGIALSPGEQMYIAESVSNRVQVFGLNGEFLLDFGGEGSAPGQFRFPAGMAMHDYLLYVADSGNHRVQVFEVIRDD